MSTCGVMLPRHMGAPVDRTGCLLPDGHSGEHQCLTEIGQRVAWENDWECRCADCMQGDDSNDWCVLYRMLDAA
jgi:hypothetical protein